MTKAKATNAFRVADLSKNFRHADIVKLSMEPFMLYSSLRETEWVIDSKNGLFVAKIHEVEVLVFERCGMK